MVLEISTGVMMGIAIGLAVYAGGLMMMEWFTDYQEGYVQRTEDDLYAMFSTMPPRRFMQWSLASFITVTALALALIGDFGSVLGFAISFAVSLALGIGGFTLPRQFLKRMGRQRLQMFELQLLDALQSMSNSLRAGFSILQAFESIVQEGRNPIAQEFDLFLREIRLGVKFETAIENLGKRVPSEDLQIVIVGIETARQTGGNLTEMFERLASVIRERMRVQGRIKSLTAMGRMQAWVVTAMVPALAAGVYFIQPHMMTGFITQPLGIMVAGVAALLVVAGYFIIQKIVAIDV
jgi:tight adherence protein B